MIHTKIITPKSLELFVQIWTTATCKTSANKRRHMYTKTNTRTHTVYSFLPPTLNPEGPHLVLHGIWQLHEHWAVNATFLYELLTDSPKMSKIKSPIIIQFSGTISVRVCFRPNSCAKQITTINKFKKNRHNWNAIYERLSSLVYLPHCSPMIYKYLITHTIRTTFAGTFQ